MERDTNVSVLLGDPKVAIRTLALPLLVSLLVAELNSAIDRAWCSGLGPDPLAAIAVVTPIYMVMVGLGTGLGVGVSAVISRYIGAGDRPKAGSCAQHSLLFAVVFSLVLTPVMILSSDSILGAIGSEDINGLAYDYLFNLSLFAVVLVVNGVVSGMLRGEGAAKAATAMVLISALMNILLDPVMIYVLDLGVSGASMATVISVFLSTMFGLSLYLRRKTFINLDIRRFRYDRSSLAEILRLGVPQMLEYTVMYAMNIALNYLILYCAGPNGLTTVSVPIMVINLAVIPSFAIGSALVPVASSAYGQCDYVRMRTAYTYSMKLSVLSVAALSLIMFLMPHLMLMPFTYTEDMQALEEQMSVALRIYCIYLPFFAMIPIGSSMLQALTVPNRSVILAVVRNLILISIYLVAAQHELYWLFWADTVGEIIGGLTMYVVAGYSFKKMVQGRSPA